MTSNALEQVRDIASDLFAVSRESISASSSPDSIETWDSTQHLSLVLALEDQFHVQFSPEEIETMTNIGAIVELVQSKLPADIR